jgi:hypothetical protein
MHRGKQAKKFPAPQNATPGITFKHRYFLSPYFL